MKLDEFAKTLHMEAVKFEAAWKKGQKSDKKNYPADLPEGDWWEQFLAFLGNKVEG